MLINVDVIRQATDDGDIKSLATFLWFKGRYSNSCYYKWSLKSLSDKTGVSRTLVRRYVAEFLKRGWCVEHNGNLLFRKTSELYKSKIPQYVDIKVKQSVKCILEDLYLTLLKRSADQFEYVKQLWDDKTKAHVTSLRHYKEIRKVCRGREIRHCEIPGFTCSMKKIAYLFNTSTSAASRIINSLKNRGRFKVISNSTYLGSIKRDWRLKHVLDMPGVFALKTGGVLKKECNAYIF